MAPYVIEYTERMTLAKLGYRFDTTKLSAFKAASFLIIASELQKIRDEKLEEMRRNGGSQL